VHLCARKEAPSDGVEALIAGGARVVLDAPLGEPVVLQREGTILVLDDAWLDSGTVLSADHATQRWSIHVHPDARGGAHGVGFDDAGDGAGATRADSYRASVDDQSAVLTWEAVGDFGRAGPVDVVLHGSAFEHVVVDGTAVTSSRVGDATVVRLDGAFREMVARPSVPR
jgi:hypothetical protein